MNGLINSKNLYTLFENRAVAICREAALEYMQILQYIGYPVRADYTALGIPIPEHCL